MKFAVLTALPLCACATVYAAAPQDAVRALASAPLRFEPSRDGSKFVASGLRYRFAFESSRAILQANGESVRLSFKGSSSNARMNATGLLRSRTNLLEGNDPARWRTGIPNYSRLEVRGLYPGIDAAYYGNGGEFEYDLAVHPGSDPRLIRLSFGGVHPRIDRDGNLVAGFIQKAPVAYQIGDDGKRIPVASRYRRNGDGTFGFTVGRYDRQRDLIIDPVLTLNTYLSGTQADMATSIGHDGKGLVYVGGTTYSGDFTAAGTFSQTGFNGTEDLFLAQLDPNAAPGSQILLSIYIGGASTQTLGDMAVAPNGMVYLTGNTDSNDFPTSNAAQSTIGGPSDAFAMAIDASQPGTANIVYSTFLGGGADDFGNGVAFDSKGRIYVAGTTRSSDLPAPNGLQGSTGATETAFVTVLDPSQSGSGTMVYESYIGGSGNETGQGIAVAPDGTFWVVGSTNSSDFPVANSPYQPNYRPGGRAFVAQIDPTKSGLPSLLYATYLGGSNPNGPDAAKRVAVDAAGRVIVAGYTGSSDFPVTSDAVQAVYGGNFDAFVTILNPKNTGSPVVYSTFYGGKQPEIPYDLKVDAAGNIYLAGLTMSPDLYVTGNSLQPASRVTMNGFALQFNPARPSLGGVNYASYIGGPGLQIAYAIDYGANGAIYVAGYTSSALLEQYGGVSKPTDPGNRDAFVMGINACGFSLPIASEAFPTQGGSDNIAVTTASSGCSWTATTPVNWITFSPASGTGSGTVKITVAANGTGSARMALVNIAGVSFQVNQD